MIYKKLDGRWSGYYTQHDHERPISAEFHQEGERLRGTMSDACTQFEATVSELAMEEGLPPGADERIVEQIRAMCPDAGSSPILAEILLPSESVVEGEVVGSAVRFQKRYQGTSFSGFRVGDVRVGVTGENEVVHYRGRINEDGTEIEGQWMHAGQPLNGLVRSRGGFYLKRMSN